MKGRDGFLLRRIHKLHRAVEELIEALLCDAVRPGKAKPSPGGGVYWHCHVRWWNPAAWVAWSRVVVFRDRYGSAFYGRARGRASPTISPLTFLRLTEIDRDREHLHYGGDRAYFRKE